MVCKELEITFSSFNGFSKSLSASCRTGALHKGQSINENVIMAPGQRLAKIVRQQR